jgi:hypothetical protein
MRFEKGDKIKSLTTGHKGIVTCVHNNGAVIVDFQDGLIPAYCYEYQLEHLTPTEPIDTGKLRALATDTAKGWFVTDDLMAKELTARDSAFIAAANPVTVLALLDRLDAAEARNYRTMELLKRYRKQHQQCIVGKRCAICRCTDEELARPRIEE